MGIEIEPTDDMQDLGMAIELRALSDQACDTIRKFHTGALLLSPQNFVQLLDNCRSIMEAQNKLVQVLLEMNLRMKDAAREIEQILENDDDE